MSWRKLASAAAFSAAVPSLSGALQLEGLKTAPEAPFLAVQPALREIQNAAQALAVDQEEEAYSRLVLEAFARPQGVYAYGVFDPDGAFRAFYARFGKPDLLGSWAPRVDFGAGEDGFPEITSLSEAKEGQQRSHLLKSQAGLTGFILHTWFKTPEAVLQAPPPYMLESSAVKKGYFYAAYRMNQGEIEAFAQDVRDQVAKEPDNLPLKLYYELQIKPALLP